MRSLVLLLMLSALTLTSVARAAVSTDAALPEPIRRAAASLGFRPDDFSLFVQEIGSPAPLLTHLPDAERTPASTMKLVTTFAALAGLNPAYTWRTEVYALGPIRDGVLEGDLLLRGYGDPYLVAEEYWKLVGAVRRHGIERISGDLVFDGSFFELPPEDPGAFDGRPDRLYNLPPHPLLVNFTAMRFIFEPDVGDGAVRVKVEPELPNVKVRNLVELDARACGGYQRGVALNVLNPDDRDLVQLEGRFPDRCQEYAMTRSVLRPESYAFGLFKLYFDQLGGVIEGGWREGGIPDGLIPLDPDTGEPDPLASDALVHVHRSPPMGEIVRLVNKYSNNVMTRHLQLTLGAELFGEPATPAKGDAAMLEILEREGVDTEGIVIGNPAGLSREARISAGQLAQVLQAAWRSPYMPEFAASLALSGLDGTLRRRFRDAAETGHMHMKTGSMNDVSAIAGFVQGHDGRRYVAVMMINAPDAHRGLGEDLQDVFLSWVYRLPESMLASR